jgi:2-polyprenyl-3-methyl-5-hydroxy-6-metoxy-1,4-benzoquinol methylase
MARTDRLRADYPLDLRARGYTYVERANSTLVAMLANALHAGSPRILDVGCGAGANLRALSERLPDAELFGIEPNAAAAKLARERARVFEVTLDQWLKDVDAGDAGKFDALVLSDVLEHLPDPFATLEQLVSAKAVAGADFFVSVPNYAVWYNRLNTLRGRFRYAWSGLYDRTHLRFFTRATFVELLERAGLRVLELRATPSLAQSFAPLLRKRFERAVDEGQHLALEEDSSFRAYQRYVEPIEGKLCELWPALLGFQLVAHARAD